MGERLDFPGFEALAASLGISWNFSRPSPSGSTSWTPYDRAEFRPLLFGTLHWRPSQPGGGGGGAPGTVQDKFRTSSGQIQDKFGRSSGQFCAELAPTLQSDLVLNCPQSSPRLAWPKMQCPTEQGAEFCTSIVQPHLRERLLRQLRAARHVGLLLGWS